MSKSNEPIERGHAEGALSGTAEAKRLAARRRFLLGGAGALPVIVTLGQKQAFAASLHVCQSAGLEMGEGFTANDQVTASLYCRN